MFSFLKKSPGEAKAELPAETPAAPSWRERLFKGLAKTRAQWGGKLKSIFSRGKVDDELLEELETLLLTSDCGIEATQHLLDELKKAAKRDKLDTPEGIQKALADALLAVLKPLEQPLDVSGHKPYVIMIAGVNGAGKTTSIGKLAKYFQNQGKSVLLAAGDTFRAAAREQLETWGERNNVTVIAQDNGDPAAVIFDAISAAKARGIDIVLADTAGRLPTQLHLDRPVAVYRRIGDPNSLFIRDQLEFSEKFTKRMEYTKPPEEVKPFGWGMDGSSRMWRGIHAEADAKAEAARCGGTCTAFPLYKEFK